MNVRILVIVVVLALIAGVVYRTGFDESDAGRQGGGERALAVKTVAVEVRDFPRVIDLPGTLEAARQVAIVAQTSGTVLRQHVQEGEQVRAGEPLFTLDARPAQAAGARYRAGVGNLLEWLTAQADLARARQVQAQADADWLAAFSRLNHALGRLPALTAEGHP